MVLHLATPTWGPPIAQDSLHLDDANIDVPPSLAARQPQLAEPLRLPVRKLGPHGQLTDEEMLVLGAFLSLQRTGNFGTDDPEGPGGINLSVKWQKMLSRPQARAALWNAFIDAANVRRIVSPSGISPVNRALALVVNPKVFCDHALTPSEPYPALALTADESKLLSAGLFQTGCTPANKNVEAFALGTDAPRADPLVAIVAQRGSLNPGFFASGALANPATLVTAEFGGVSMRRREGAERRWSLAEWEESGVCGPSRRIMRIGVSGALSDLGIVGREGASSASYKVVEDLSSVGVARQLKPIPGIWHLAPAITPEDLDRLTPGDLKYVVWTRGWSAPSPDPCQP